VRERLECGQPCRGSKRLTTTLELIDGLPHRRHEVCRGSAGRSGLLDHRR
jgi:hypothetical protein